MDQNYDNQNFSLILPKYFQMKSYIVFKNLWILSLIILSTAACKNDEGEFSEESLLGDFKGEIMYSEGQQELTIPEGWVKISKSGENFELDFPNEIPSINGVEFELNNEALLNINATEDQIIRISTTALYVNFSQNDSVKWIARCLKEF